MLRRLLQEGERKPLCRPQPSPAPAFNPIGLGNVPDACRMVDHRISKGMVTIGCRWWSCDE